MAAADSQPSLDQPDRPWLAQLRRLSGGIDGAVLLPDDRGYGAECCGFDLSVSQRPGVVIAATGTADIAAAVRFAAAHELPVGVQATGHGPTVPADGGVLINTRRAGAIEVDAATRTAYAQAGATWSEVIRQAAPLGLAPLAGSAPGVGAVSYTLGGGLGLLGRPHGFAADHVRAIELIAADGELRRLTADSDSDLFWALRGAGTNFGVVTGLEVALMPVPELYGGGLFFPGAARAEVLAAFVECAAVAPDSLTLSVAILTFPELPLLPPQLRGRHTCHVRVAQLGAPAEAEAAIRPLRHVGSLMLDAVRPLPLAEIGTIHNDPTTPLEVHARSVVLNRLSHDLVRTVVEHTGPEAGSVVELRHLGGALGRPPAVANAVGHRDGVANLFATAYPALDYACAEREQLDLLAAVAPWSSGGALLTFLSGPHVTAADVRAAYRPEDYERLVVLKRRWDPANLFRFNKNIAPAS